MADDYDLQWALTDYQSPSRLEIVKAYRYYDGEHRLRYATSQWRKAFAHLFEEFCDNLCPGVVDSLAERLEVTGWMSNQATVTVEDVPGSQEQGIPARKKVTTVDPLGESAQKLWDANEMASRANLVHTEAIKSGNAYILIWPNRQMEPEFYPQTAAEMCIQYDPNALGVVARGSKLWYLPEMKKWRLNIYLPNQIVKWISRDQMPNGISDNVASWVRFDDPQTGPIVANPYGIVPIFHFANKALYSSGCTELKSVIPLQDALNKSILDMLVAMEYASFRQRYIVGIEPEVDEITGEPVDSNVRGYGVNRMMAVPGDKTEIEVGEFQSTDLGQFRQVSADFRKEVATVSGTPLHYFFITSGDFPSGEAIKSAEARFVTKIEDRQADWTTMWARAMTFAQGISDTLPDDYLVEPLWKEAQPRSESELADVAVKKKAVGVSRSQLLKEMGYDDDTISRMLEESDAYAATQASLAAQSRGPDVQPGTEGNGTGTGSGGGSPEAVAGAAAARRAGRVPGVRQ